MAALAKSDCLAQLKDIASFIAGGYDARERRHDHERLSHLYDELLDRYAVLLYEEGVAALKTCKRGRKALVRG